MTKPIVAFRNFANAPNKVKFTVEQAMTAQRRSKGTSLLFL
jgi:hypothetical protein